MNAGVQTVPDEATPSRLRTPEPPAKGTTVASLTCLLLLMAWVAARAAQPVGNADTWFHLRIGHLLWGDWSIAHPGRLSRFATSPWVPTQWSTEVVAAKTEDWFGLPGVAWLFGALSVFLVGAVYLLCRREGSPLAATVATGLAVIGASPTISARPQVVSLLLLCVCLGSWLRSSQTLRVPWHLVPLTWLWATAHGLWSAGVIVGFVCWLGIVLDRRPDRRTALRLLSVPLLSVVAVCLTPVGPTLLTSQLAVGRRAPMIDEWAATSFRTLPAFVVALMIGLVVMRWARSREVGWLPLLLLLLACGWTALVTRMVSTGAIIVAPLLAGAVQDLVASRRARTHPRRAELAVVGSGVVACLAALALVVPSTARDAANVPLGFASRLSALPKGSAVAVEDGTGAWIEYRFPGLDPVIDGMLDAYPIGYIEDFFDYRVVKPGWQDFLHDSGARVAVVRADSALTAAMTHQLHWRAVQEDGAWVYLVAPGATS